MLCFHWQILGSVVADCLGDFIMPENELLKQINRELRVTSLENSEKKAARNKDEADDNDKKDSDEILDDENELNSASENDEQSDDTDDVMSEENVEAEREALDDLQDVESDIEDVASEQTDEVKDELSDVVLSSAPQLLDPEDLPTERNEIDDPVDTSGILKDYKSDKTSDFIDPNGDDSDKNQLKVVDTALGVFTILNNDDKNVLLLDSNKQKIQISINDFNNLHPFEIKDDMLSDVNSFTDAFEKDLKKKKEKQEMDAEEGGDEDETEFEEGEDESEDEEPAEEGGDAMPDLGGFGESVKRRRRVKKENKNLISEIQKGLSQKAGVVETIRSDVRGKNRCVLVAKQAKTTKESRMNETRPKPSNSVINSYKKKNQNNVLESKKKKEATQVADIAQAPRGVFSDDDNFDLNKVVTIKDGKYVLVKLEGKYKTAYLRLLPKRNISINELKFILNDVETFNESLKEIKRGFTLIEKEIVAMKTKKYEAEEVEEKEEIEDDEELEEVEVDDDEDEKDGDADDAEADDEKDDDADEDEAEEAEDEEAELAEDQPDSVPFSVEINGVRYSGTLYAEKDDDADEDDDEESDEDEQDEDDDDYADLILQSDDDIDELDFPNGLDDDDEIIDADVELENVRYNVSFYDVKKECIKRAKLEMRKHNKIGAWNALVRGAKSIEC
jgi:hypothetical protein